MPASDRIISELRAKPKPELLRIFDEEVLRPYIKLFVSYIESRLKLKEFEKQGRYEEYRETSRRLARIRRDLKVFEDAIGRELKIGVTDIEAGKDKALEDIDSESLIRIIAGVKLRNISPSSRIARRFKSRRYRYPYDWAGYDPRKYPSSIGLNPDKVRCVNCRHWDKKKQLCLIQRRKTAPNRKCWEFSRRGL